MHNNYPSFDYVSYIFEIAHIKQSYSNRRLGQGLFLYNVLSRKFELTANIFFECTVFIFSFSQIQQPDMHHTDRNNRYYLLLAGYIIVYHWSVRISSTIHYIDKCIILDIDAYAYSINYNVQCFSKGWGC